MADLTITTGELLAARQGLLAIGEKPLKNIKAAYAIAKIKRQAMHALEDLEKVRLALCQKYGTLNDETGSYEFGEMASEFETDWRALMQEPVALPGCRALALEELDGTEGVTPDMLFQLGPFVVTDE